MVINSFQDRGLPIGNFLSPGMGTPVPVWLWGVVFLLELGTTLVFLVGIWLVFLGFYRTDTGGKLSRYISVLTWSNQFLLVTQPT
jgi:hypothetical protein